MSTLNNLAITTTNRLKTTAIGRAFDTLQSLIANDRRDSNCKFYYNNGAGVPYFRLWPKVLWAVLYRTSRILPPTTLILG